MSVLDAAVPRLRVLRKESMPNKAWKKAANNPKETSDFSRILLSPRRERSDLNPALHLDTDPDSLAAIELIETEVRVITEDTAPPQENAIKRIPKRALNRAVVQHAIEFPVDLPAPDSSNKLANRVAKILMNKKSPEEGAGRALKMLYCAAGGQIESTPDHPETHACARKLTELSDDDRFKFLNALHEQLGSHHLKRVQNDVIANYLGSIGDKKILEKDKELRSALILNNPAEKDSTMRTFSLRNLQDYLQK